MVNSIQDSPNYMQPDSLGIDDLGSIKSNAVKGTRLDRILQLSRKRRNLNQEIKEFSRAIKPMEFESYHDYFLINTFKKGVSASGHVDLEGLKSRNNGRYYKRIKRGQNPDTRESNGSNPNGSLSDDDNDNDAEDDEAYDRNRFFVGDSDDNEPDSTPPKRVTRAQLAAKKETQKSVESLEKVEQTYKNLINGDISVTSIISTADSENSIRRSSRLSQKSNESSAGESAGSDMSETAVINIKDLYESLVSKVSEPYRRSDWVLPSKNRYTADKQMRTKPVYEKIKVNELVNTDRVRNVLSKFEGGVAGVRKRS